MTSILIIYTGGTIGMVESDDRKFLVPFDLDHVLSYVPELHKLGVSLESVSFDEPIDSSDMHPSHWSRMANIIKDSYSSFDGFVILHGSDTLAYTASALSFMLEGLNKPVILTGSQLPIGMIRTDAKENLITAVEIAAQKVDGVPVVQEVAICFEDMLYRGNRTKKFSTQAFEAFISPNYPVLCEAGVTLSFDHQELYRTTFSDLNVMDGFCQDVAVLTLFPGIQEHLIRMVMESPNIRGIVLMTFGSGNAPILPWFFELMKGAIDRGVIVANVSQCAKGKVEQGKYETSSSLKDIGVVSCGDMTLEAALTKLMFLLHQSNDSNWVKDQMLTNLRGELTVS